MGGSTPPSGNSLEGNLTETHAQELVDFMTDDEVVSYYGPGELEFFTDFEAAMHHRKWTMADSREQLVCDLIYGDKELRKERSL